MADHIANKREKEAEHKDLLPLGCTDVPGVNASSNAASSAPEIKKTEVMSEESDVEKRDKELAVADAETRKKSGHGADDDAGYKKKPFPERYEDSMKMLLPVRCAPQLVETYF